MTPAQAFAALHRLPSKDALDWLAQRDTIVQTLSWAQLSAQQHERAFTVSRLANADLLAEIRRQIIASVNGDLSRRDFERDVKAMLIKAGWWGTREVVDPSTGQILKTRFDPNRLRLIYDTNVRHAYSVAQWGRFQATKKRFPYVRWLPKDPGEGRRPLHQAWRNLTLPVDSEWVKTHWTPCGWGCQCRWVQMSQDEYERGLTPTGQSMVKQEPQTVWMSRPDPYNVTPAGRGVIRTPAGVDPGFGQAPEAATDALNARQQVIAATKEAALFHRSMSYLSQVISAPDEGFKAAVAAAQSASPPLGRTFVVGTITDQVAQAVQQHLQTTLESRDISISDAQIAHILRESKAERMADLPVQLLNALPAYLQIANAWIDPINHNLIYTVSLGPTLSKIAVHINYRKGRRGARQLTNSVATGGLVQPDNTSQWIAIQ